LISATSLRLCFLYFIVGCYSLIAVCYCYLLVGYD